MADNSAIDSEWCFFYVGDVSYLGKERVPIDFYLWELVRKVTQLFCVLSEYHKRHLLFKVTMISLI